VKLKCLVPMLNVSNIEKSLRFYEEAFGFEVISDPKMVQKWKWATIRSGDTELMISESEGNPNLEMGINSHSNSNWPCVYYFHPDSVEALYDHVIKCGYKPTALEITFYGMNEFSIQDPDGHLLSFGQEESQTP
jgi:uncharacterized glyoxalase superfamily protein PhnB